MADAPEEVENEQVETGHLVPCPTYSDVRPRHLLYSVELLASP